MDIKSFIKDSAEKEKNNHRILNIMVIVVLSLTIIFTLCFGVKVDIGSAVMGDDDNKAYVRQNFFQISSLVFDNNMSREDAIQYVESTNKVLKDEYGVLGLNTELLYNNSIESDPGAYGNLEKFDDIVDELGSNASKVNLVKYKFAYAVAISNLDNPEHAKAFNGSRIYSITGQLMLVFLTQAAFIIISVIMLIFAILALVKKKKFGKARFTFVLLLICSAVNLVLFSCMSFVSMNWAGYLVMIITLLGSLFYCLLQHALMEKRDFSFTMFIHNAVLLAGGVLALALFLSPLFKLTNATGVSTTMGWAYLMDYMLAEMSFMSAIMAYTLTEFIMLVFVLLPAILLIVLIILQLARFMLADYQHNEKRIFIIVTLIINFFIFLLFIVGSINGNLEITSQYIDVRMNIALAVIQLLVLGGILAFEILYKVKPIKKELVVR